MNYFFLFVTCAAAAWFCGFFVYWLLKKWRVFDVPNARSSHSAAVVRGGGLAVLAGIGIGALMGGGEGFFGLAGWMFAVAVVLVAGISFLDDLYEIRSSIRFLIHLIAGVLALLALGFWGWIAKEIAPGGFGNGAEVITAALVGAGVVWVVGYTNAFNFMDGINGLAVGQTVVVGGFGSWICWVAAPSPGMEEVVVGTGGQAACVQLGIILSGSALGFLPHNFPKARMFLGDVGSVPLGFLHAVLVTAVLVAFGWRAGMAVGAMHLNFLMDTTITLFRRWRRGERLYEAHREHFYQRLHRSGVSHFGVTGMEMGLQILFGFCLVGSFALGGSSFWILLALIAVGWCGFFRYCEMRLRAAERAVK